MNGGDPLPPLVLRCRLPYLAIYGGGAVVFMGIGIAGLAMGWPWLGTPGHVVLLLLGAGCAWFTARHALARVLLDAQGFRLVGPLRRDDVAWREVVRWERRPHPGGPATLRVVHGPSQKRLSIPMIYESCHFLEVGLAQGRFPEF